MRLLGAGRSFGCFFILWRGTEYADNHADKKEAHSRTAKTISKRNKLSFERSAHLTQGHGNN